jgi:hypothetical protein
MRSDFSNTKRMIYFDQHYADRGLVNFEEYKMLILSIKEICRVNKIDFFYKAHPGKTSDISFLKLKDKNILLSYIPSEFTIDKNTISVSTSSGALADLVLNNKISLLDLMPFNQDKYKDLAKKALSNKILTPVYIPRDIAEFSTLIKDIGALRSKNKKLWTKHTRIIPN